MKPLAGVLFLIVVAGLVGTLIGRSTRSATAPIGSRQAASDAGMDRIVPIVHFDDLPLDKAIDALREATHANFAVNWRGLEAAGIDKTTPVTLKLTNIPLGQALRLLLDGTGGGVVPLRAEANASVIVVSTAEDLDRRTEARVYDVRDLLIADAQFIYGGGPATRPAGGGASLFYTAPPSTAPVNPYEESVDRLKRIIMDTIAPDSWRDNGGTIGSVNDFDGLLIITSTPQYHQEIADLLEMIRARGN